MTTDVAIIGVGLHPFGRFEGVPALELGARALSAALADAGVAWSDVQAAFGGSVDPVLPGRSGSMADSLVNHMGLTGIPFVNVANGCATAGTALHLAAESIRVGAADVAVAVGFDKHARGHFNADPAVHGLDEWYGRNGLMVTTQFFALKIQRYMHDHGISVDTLARVAAKNHANGSLNPNAWRREPFTVADVLASPMLNPPLTQYMFCSPNEGAAAAVLCRADRAVELGAMPIWLRAVTLRTRRFGTFEVFSPSLAVESAPSPTADAAAAAWESSGVGPGEVDVFQLQDGEAGAEVMHMAEVGLCADGEQEDLVQSGATEIAGAMPINTDGGLIANGEPIGASGLRQIHELVVQLRGAAGNRQVPGEPRTGFAQVYGAPGVSCCAVLSR